MDKSSIKEEFFVFNCIVFVSSGILESIDWDIVEDFYEDL